MADTIIDQIVDDLKATLLTVTTGNGYETTVESVYEPLTIQGYTKPPMKSLQVQLTMMDGVRNPEIDLQSNPPRVGWNQNIDMNLIYRPSDSNTTPIRVTLNKFWADVIKAMYIDYTRGGLALNQEISNPEWMLNQEDGFIAIACILTIQYRHKENNPYEQ
jgi:hypothetical protein